MDYITTDSMEAGSTIPLANPIGDNALVFFNAWAMTPGQDYTVEGNTLKTLRPLAAGTIIHVETGYSVSYTSLPAMNAGQTLNVQIPDGEGNIRIFFNGIEMSFGGDISEGMTLLRPLTSGTSVIVARNVKTALVG